MPKLVLECWSWSIIDSRESVVDPQLLTDKVQVNRVNRVNRVKTNNIR